jgi:nucleotide-binding universal stress UspA family protein
MTYRSILVHLDRSENGRTRVEFAIRLAEEMGCHLVGLAPTGSVMLPGTTGPVAKLAQYAEMAWEALGHEADAAASKFREECRAAGLKSFEAVRDVADKAASLVRHIHCSDLGILTQPTPNAGRHGEEHLLVEEVMLRSARPTLILPNAGRCSAPKRALVAWDDGREASRAVSDALALLRRTDHVEVVSWKQGAEDESSMTSRLEALRHWLMWQGVTASTRVEVAGSNLGTAILSLASHLHTDLIVMGGYGHSRWSERVLGGATRSILDNAEVPVLMSH